MKIYTGAGDRGQTSLLSGERVSKSHMRVDACGDIDELNSTLGALVAALPESPAVNSSAAGLAAELQHIQSTLFIVGARLATMPDSPAMATLAPITPAHSKQLEAAMDRMDAELPELASFILPGGHPAATWAHVARAVCRRAERHVVRLGEAQDSEQLYPIIVYLNRLSDYLFVLARYCNKVAGVDDMEWQP